MPDAVRPTNLKNTPYDSSVRTSAHHRAHPAGGGSRHRMHRADGRGAVCGACHRDAGLPARKNHGAVERQHPQERHGRGYPRHGRHDRPPNRHCARRTGRPLGVPAGGASRHDARGGRTWPGVYRLEVHLHRSEGGHHGEALHRGRGRSLGAPGRGGHRGRSYELRLRGARRRGAARQPTRRLG